jgi:NAD(P)H-quinone oxidoreductase subunit 5
LPEVAVPNAIPLLLFLAPAALCLVGVIALFQLGLRPRRVLWAGRAASFATLLLAVVGGAAVAMHGTMVGPVLGIGEVGLSIRLDALSAVMFCLVAFMGVILVQFSRNYLDGDERQGAFVGWLCLALAAVSLLVLSGNLYQLVGAWIATAAALQRLLLFYRERPAATVGARKKWIVSRLGEVCLVGAAVLLVRAFGTADIGAILGSARAALGAGEVPAGVTAAAVLLALAALLKSAQFPTHGWLPEVMETPTPVSALLHAGIINAGTFLVVRFADVMLLAAPSMYLLVAVGSFTALFASAVMITQPAVKVSLAYSSVAHMGFMLLLCGIGAFSAAILHLVAHSFYKAHAFLSSGSVVESTRAAWVPATDGRHSPAWIVASFAVALLTLAGVAMLLGVSLLQKPAAVAVGALFVIGIAHLLAQASVGKPSAYLVIQVWLAATATALAFVVLEKGTEAMLAAVLPAAVVPGGAMIGLIALVVVAFGAVSLLQLLVPARGGLPAWRAAYVHASNGFYVNALFDRLVGALRRAAVVNP